MKEYYVVAADTTSIDVDIYKFNDRKEAEDFLTWLWEDRYNTAIADDEYLDEEFVYHADNYAQIRWMSGECIGYSLYSRTDTIPEEFINRKRKENK